jgi:hypothetical protein
MRNQIPRLRPFRSRSRQIPDRLEKLREFFPSPGLAEDKITVKVEVNVFIEGFLAGNVVHGS